MRVKFESIGNSKAVRIPAAIIDSCGFGDEAELHVEPGRVILRPADGVRAGWNEAFARMAENGDDVLLMPDTIEHSWDDAEWEW